MKWLWVDAGSVIDENGYQNFGSGDTSQSCVAMTSSGTWYSGDCANGKFYICQALAGNCVFLF